MKPVLKKSLIIGSSVVIPIGLIGLGVGVYFATPIVQRISSKGIFSMRVNENLNNEGYKFDYSASYGSPTSNNRLSLLVNNEILHLKTSGQFKYKQAIKNENGEIVSPAEVEQPSYESLKFANANGIVLTFISTNLNEQDITPTFFSKEQKFSDGTKKYFQLVFDRDDDEITPKPAKKDQVVVTKTSKNTKSINNPDVFGKIIADGYLDKEINLNELDENNPNINTSSKNYILAGLGITFNTNAKWVDSDGNETKYNISPRDMLYSAKRTWLYDKTYRRSHGGSKELDQYFIEKTQTIKIFGETQKYPNEYLFDFFGVNTEKLYDEKWAIQKVNVGTENEKDAYTFSFNIFEKNGSINKNFLFSATDIIKKYLSNSLHFSLAPSQYIDELAKIDSINKTPKGEIKGEARQFGIYTYAQTRESTLFASTYIPVSASAGREIYEYNKHYANSEWVESVEKSDENGYKTINKVIIEYAGSIDSSTFINQSFSSFLNGTLSQVDYALLTDAQKEKLYGNGKTQGELTDNSIKNGLQVTKKVNISSMTSRMVWQANPIDQLGTNSYLFNNNYAKLVYGASLDEINQGKATTSNSFYAGLGFDFRLLIQASINWYQYIQWAYSGTRDVWLSGAAQNAMFSSFEDSLTPVDFNEKGMNDLIYFDVDGNKRIVTLKEMKELSNSSKEEIEQKYGPEAAANLQLTKMKSPHYQQIQNAVKKILDDFYIQNGINKSEKIVWQIAYPFADQDDTKVAATQYLVENIINGLDDRIKANFFKPTTREEMLSAINQRKGGFNANLWSYDYEGIGSYISGYTSDGGGINIVNAFGIFSKDPTKDSELLFQDKVIDGITVKRPTKDTVTKLQQLFPKFTELAKFVREKMNEELNKELNLKKADDSLQVENWDLINNNQNNNIVRFFTQKWSDKDNAWIPDNTKNPNQINPVSTLSAIFKLFEAEASWQKNNVDKNSAGQGWVDLIQELNSIKGVSIDTESSVERLENVNYILYLREYVVPLSKYGLQVYSDITYKK